MFERRGYHKLLAFYQGIREPLRFDPAPYRRMRPVSSATRRSATAMQRTACTSMGTLGRRFARKCPVLDPVVRSPRRLSVITQ